MASTEDIEAKLCAYIEGVLDPADRADIEKHLEANPHHRALLAELGKTRPMLQALPRESAPDDILEAVQEQLERSALLQDGAADQSTHALRINRWPQLLATAAVLLLTVGLGVVIYFVLPRSNGTSYSVVNTESVEPATTTASGTRDDGAELSEERGLDRALADKSETTVAAADAAITPAAPAASPADTIAGAMAKSAEPLVFTPSTESKAADVFSPAKGAPSGASVSDADAAKMFDASQSGGIDFEAAKDQLANADLARQLKETPGGLKDNALFVVVTTDDAGATKSQVAGFLTSNSIQWDELTQAPEPLEIAKDQAFYASRKQRIPEYRLKSSAAKEKQSENQAQNTVEPSPLQEGVQGGAQVAPPAPTDPREARSGLAAVSAPEQEALDPMSDEHPEELIVARSMTRSQATQLQESLSSQLNVYRARLYGEPGAVDHKARADAAETDARQSLAYTNLAVQLGMNSHAYARNSRRAESQESAVATQTEAPAPEPTEPAATSQPALQQQQQAAAPATAPDMLDVVIVVRDQPIQQQQQVVAPNASPTRPAAPAENLPATTPATPPTTTPVP